MRFFVINVNFRHVKDTSRPKTKIIKRIISLLSVTYNKISRDYKFWKHYRLFCPKCVKRTHTLDLKWTLSFKFNPKRAFKAIPTLEENIAGLGRCVLAVPFISFSSQKINNRTPYLMIILAKAINVLPTLQV